MCGIFIEYLFVEKVWGGWQNGGMFYFDGEVMKIMLFYVILELQGELFDVQVEVGCFVFYEYVFGLMLWECLVEYDVVIVDCYCEGICCVLCVVGGV